MENYNLQLIFQLKPSFSSGIFQQIMFDSQRVKNDGFPIALFVCQSVPEAHGSTLGREP
jgi:hypothetical protein